MLSGFRNNRRGINVLLYFGSFNPIHNGHLAIVDWMIGEGYCGEAWLIVSPQNPFKTNGELAPENDRLQMARLAVQDLRHRSRVKVSDIEFRLPKPSYTIDTVSELAQHYPDDRFSILIGGDNAAHIDLWKDYETLLAICPMWVYPRTGYENPPLRKGMTLLKRAPRFDFSSTDVRRAIETGGDASRMIPEPVYRYIKEHKIWTANNSNTRSKN